MEKITFTKAGIGCTIWDHKLARWTDLKFDETQIPFSWCLPYQVEIEDNMTIQDVLNSLKSQSDHVNYIFANPLMGLKLEELIDALVSATKKERSTVNAICLMWNAEMRREENNGVAMYPMLMGVEMNDDEDDDRFHDLYDLSAVDILEKQLVLDDWLEVIDDENPDEPVLDGAFAWSMYDFISGILSELTLFAYSYGLISLPNGVQTSPVSIVELLSHIDDIDRIVKDEGEL